MEKKYIYFGATLFIFLILQILFFSSYRDTDDHIYSQDFNKNHKTFSLIKPEEIDFCDEKTPVFNNHVWERLDKELVRNTYFQSNTLFYFKRANKYFPIIEPILKKNRIPDDFKYLAIAESGLQNVISPSGAAGFWQILEVTGKEYNLEINLEVDERYHLEKATEVACKYLQEAYDKFGSWTMAAASYNLGRNGISKRIDQQKSNNYYNLHLNPETAAYIFRILAIKEIMENPKKYGFLIRNKDLYSFEKTKEVVFNQQNIQLPIYAREIGINYKILKTYNPWIRTKYLTNASKKEYQIKIPIYLKNIIFEDFAIQ